MPQELVPGLHRPAGPAFALLPVSVHRVNHICDTPSLSCPRALLLAALSQWYSFSFVSTVFSFFKFCGDEFLSHRIPVFFHQTPVVRTTACWTPAGTSKRELPVNASAGLLATLNGACPDGKH